MVDHEEIDGGLGADGAMNVHDVEVEWNVATFNVQLDETFPQPCGKPVENARLYSQTVLAKPH